MKNFILNYLEIATLPYRRNIYTYMYLSHVFSERMVLRKWTSTAAYSRNWEHTLSKETGQLLMQFGVASTRRDL
jgi:hypothetical protein